MEIGLRVAEETTNFPTISRAHTTQEASGIGPLTDPNDTVDKSEHVAPSQRVPSRDDDPPGLVPEVSVTPQAPVPSQEAPGVGPLNDPHAHPVLEVTGSKAPETGSAASSSARPDVSQLGFHPEPLDVPADSASDVVGPLSIFRQGSAPGPDPTVETI